MAIGDNLKPAAVYEGISTGPGFSRTYETQEGVPVDASKAILRDPTYGSPFTFRVVPPLILLDALANQEEQQSIDILGAALKVNDTFADYERKINQFRDAQAYTLSNENLVRLETFISNKGVQFNALTGQASLANDLAFSDLRHAASVLSQLRRMVETPPLTMLVNPQSMTITHTKKQQYTDRNRDGYIFQSWGEEQVRINISGKTGAWYAGSRFTDSGAPENFRGLGAESRGRVSESTAVSGLQAASRVHSASWQNFQALLAFYRNNGYIYDLVDGSEAHEWIGGIAIDYDQWTYVGHFENFGYGHTEQTMLGGVEFTFDFVASSVFDNAQREFQVLPINSPTPSPSSALWSEPNKRPTARTGTLRGRLAPNPRNDPPQVGSRPDPVRQALIRSRR